MFILGDDDDDDDDDDDLPPLMSNITESPLQQVATSGNIQILVDVSSIQTDPPVGEAKFALKQNTN